MHEIITTLTINDVTEVEVATFDFSNQEEVIEFLNDYEGMELDRLYDELRKLGDRTFAAVKQHHRKAMSRHIEGTTRKDGCSPIDGSITITVNRVA